MKKWKARQKKENSWNDWKVLMKNGASVRLISYFQRKEFPHQEHNIFIIINNLNKYNIKSIKNKLNDYEKLKD